MSSNYSRRVIRTVHRNQRGNVSGAVSIFTLTATIAIQMVTSIGGLQSADTSGINRMANRQTILFPVEATPSELTNAINDLDQTAASTFCMVMMEQERIVTTAGVNCPIDSVLLNRLSLLARPYERSLITFTPDVDGRDILFSVNPIGSPEVSSGSGAGLGTNLGGTEECYGVGRFTACPDQITNEVTVTSVNENGHFTAF